MQAQKFQTVDEYLSSVPAEMRERLEGLRKTIKSAAPNAEEIISYGMPAYKQDGMLVYFAAAKSHIGFYPTASPIVEFKDELAKYKTSKGAIQFPLEKPIPAALVKKIVKFKMDENRRKAELKNTKKK